MSTSARTRSGFNSLTYAHASLPFEATLTVTSSALNVISTAFWIVTESSASSRDLGTRNSLRADAREGAFHVYPPFPSQASFRNHCKAVRRSRFVRESTAYFERAHLEQATGGTGYGPRRIKRIRRGGGGPARPPAARDCLVEREDAADWTSRSSFRRSKHRARRAPSRRRTGRGRAEGEARRARRDTRADRSCTRPRVRRSCRLPRCR